MPVAAAGCSRRGVRSARAGSTRAHAACPPLPPRRRLGPRPEAGRRAQVCDLGLARNDELWSDSSHSAASNPRWVAPEVLTGGAHSTASDVYAFGIVMCAPPVCIACSRCMCARDALSPMPRRPRCAGRDLAALCRARPGRAA